MISTAQARHLQAEHVAEQYRSQAEDNLADAITSYLEEFSLWDLQKELIRLLSAIALPSGRQQKTVVAFHDQVSGEYV